MGKDTKTVPHEFTGAFKHGHRRGVREYIDDEFSLQLLRKAQAGSKEALEALLWITKYNNEAYRGVLKKNDSQAIHNTPELYKEVNDAHNARRRDITCIIKSGIMGSPDLLLLEYSAEIIDSDALRDLDHENTVIDLTSPVAKSRLGAKKKTR